MRQWSSQEEVVIVEISIHVAGNLRSLRSKGWTSAFEENYYNDASTAGIGVRGKPAEARAGVGAGPGFSEDFFLVEVKTQTASRTILHGAGHANGDFRNQRSDIELPLDARAGNW